MKPDGRAKSSNIKSTLCSKHHNAWVAFAWHDVGSIAKINVISIWIFYRTKWNHKLLNTYIIGHHNPSVRIIELVSHTTYVVFVNFMYKWRDLQFKFDSERQIFWETFHGSFNLLSEFLPEICWFMLFKHLPFILFIFKQDSGLKHTSKLAKDWFYKEHITVLDWPVQISVLNSVENP